MTAGCTLSPVAKQTAGGYLLRGMKRGKELSFASADGLVNSGVMNKPELVGVPVPTRPVRTDQLEPASVSKSMH